MTMQEWSMLLCCSLVNWVGFCEHDTVFLQVFMLQEVKHEAGKAGILYSNRYAALL